MSNVYSVPQSGTLTVTFTNSSGTRTLGEDCKYCLELALELCQKEEKIKELEEKIRIAVMALTEASEYNNTDDVNGFAGSIAKEDLEKLK